MTPVPDPRFHPELQVPTPTPTPEPPNPAFGGQPYIDTRMAVLLGEQVRETSNGSTIANAAANNAMRKQRYMGESGRYYDNYGHRPSNLRPPPPVPPTKQIVIDDPRVPGYLLAVETQELVCEPVVFPEPPAPPAPGNLSLGRRLETRHGVYYPALLDDTMPNGAKVTHPTTGEELVRFGKMGGASYEVVG